MLVCIFNSTVFYRLLTGKEDVKGQVFAQKQHVEFIPIAFWKELTNKRCVWSCVVI